MGTIAEYMRLAVAVSKDTDDADHGTGCVFVTLTNHVIPSTNKLPAGCHRTFSRVNRPGKYDWMGHAERRGVSHAAKGGIALEGATGYMLFAPCHLCVAAMIDAGISSVVIDAKHHFQNIKPHWKDSWVMASQMAWEADLRLYLWYEDSNLMPIKEIPTCKD